MALLKSIAIGPGRGSAGDATYRQVDGRTIMSARVRTNASKSTAQTIQRGLFGRAAAFATSFSPCVDVFFDKLKYGTKYNQFIKSNWPSLKDWAHQDPATAGSFIKWALVNQHDQATGTYLAKGSAPVLGILNGQQVYGKFPYVQEKGTYSILINVKGIDVNTMTLGWSAFMPDFPIVNRFLPRSFRFGVQVVSDAEALEMTPDDCYTIMLSGKLPAVLGSDGNLEVMVPLKSAAILNPQYAQYATRYLGIAVQLMDDPNSWPDSALYGLGEQPGSTGYRTIVVNGSAMTLQR